MTDRFDVVVVGAGPGGLAAAATAAEAGRTVCVVDDNPAAGGQIWRGIACSSRSLFARTGTSAKATSLFARVGLGADAGKTESSRLGVTVWTGMRVVDAPERDVLRLEGVDGARDVRFGKLILATGARERFLPFPGWTLPGVMGAGGVQAFLKSGLDVKGRRAVVAGSGPLLLAVGALLREKGARVAAICEQAPLGRLARFGAGLWRHPKKLMEGAQYRVQSRFAPYKAGCWVVRAEGAEKLERVRVTDGRQTWTVECDLLACGYNLVPNLELPLLLGCDVEDGLVRVDAEQRSSREDVYCVGELTGVGGLDKALAEGEAAGWAAAGYGERVAGLVHRLDAQKRFARELERAFALRPELRSLPDEDTLVCRCEDVPFVALCGQTGWRDAKLHTRAGMGACQGRVCGAAAEFLLGWKKRDARPPVFPASVGTMSTACGVPLADRSRDCLD